MKEQNVKVQKWTGNEKIEWGDTKVEFFIKDEKVLFGNLKVPPNKNTPLDNGHPNGEYIFVRQGSATVTLTKDGSEVGKTDIKEGESIFIPQNLDHQTVNTGTKELSLIFFINF